jgi:hypothetical protein
VSTGGRAQERESQERTGGGGGIAYAAVVSQQQLRSNLSNHGRSGAGVLEAGTAGERQIYAAEDEDGRGVYSPGRKVSQRFGPHAWMSLTWEGLRASSKKYSVPSCPCRVEGRMPFGPAGSAFVPIREQSRGCWSIRLGTGVGAKR